MAQPHVPKFGDWGAGGSAYPYTVCFDNARKGRAGEKSESEKPNTPQEETPNLHQSPFQPPQPRARPHREQHKPRPDNNNNNSDHHRQSGSNHSSKNGHNRRTRPQSIGDNFTSHCQSQSPPELPPVRVKNSGNKDTASSGKGSSYDKVHNNAKANRVRHSSMGDEHCRVGVALPKFGQWDMSPTGSDGGYTQVFNLVREEKKNTAKSPLQLQVDQPHHDSGRRKSTGGMVTCCFPWSKR